LPVGNFGAIAALYVGASVGGSPTGAGVGPVVKVENDTVRRVAQMREAVMTGVALWGAVFVFYIIEWSFLSILCAFGAGLVFGTVTTWWVLVKAGKVPV
jgi:hypothetical protein